MARLISQVKGGFYAAAPEAVTAVLERLRPPDCGECLILDPCAGAGMALLQLARGLNAVPYGIELSEDRAAVVRESLPEGQALAPADFLRCAISYRSFSFIWCNPPYDYATGEEGRVESQFLERAFHLLAENGVLALVCPEDVASSYRLRKNRSWWRCLLPREMKGVFVRDEKSRHWVRLRIRVRRDGYTFTLGTLVKGKFQSDLCGEMTYETETDTLLNFKLLDEKRTPVVHLVGDGAGGISFYEFNLDW